MSLVTKRSTMTFFSDPTDHMSHRVRIVLAEKGVTVDVVDCDPDDIPAEVSEINPYNNLPTLFDRDLVLYEPNIMIEYLDERFPHPPLLPVYPVARANARMFLHRIEKEWTPLIRTIEAAKHNNKRSPSAVKELKEQLIAVAPIFEEMPYFMSEEFSLVDCYLAPLLWRLPALGIELNGAGSKEINAYMNRIFSRSSFKASLTDQEREIHNPL